MSAKLRSGDQVTLFSGVSEGTSAVYEIADTVHLLTLYGVFGHDETESGKVQLQTALDPAFAGFWYSLATVGTNNDVVYNPNGMTSVAFAPGEVSFVRAVVVGSFASVSATLLVR